MLRRAILGFALAPLPVLSPFVFGIALSLFSQDRDSTSFAIFNAKILVAGYGLTLLFGVPIHLYLKRTGRTRFGPYFALSAASAVVMSAALIFYQLLIPSTGPFALHLSAQESLTGTMGLILVCGFTASIFWRIAVRPPLRNFV